MLYLVNLFNSLDPTIRAWCLLLGIMFCLMVLVFLLDRLLWSVYGEGIEREREDMARIFVSFMFRRRFPYDT